MGLLSKFVLLTGALSAAVALNIIATAWAINMLERELSWPLLSMQAALDGVHGVREELIQLDRADIAGRLSPDEARQSLGRIRERLDQLGVSIPTKVRVGIGTETNLRDRFAAMGLIVDAWDDGDDSARDEFRSARLSATVLIGRVEQRVIDDSALAVDFGHRLRHRVFSMILISAVLTLAAIGLSAVYVRRWVLRPVEELRRGARRLASGDLGHRVPIVSEDQLGLLAEDFNIMASTIGRLQNERIERERLAAIGEMLRRVVHNLRTPLAGIRGLAESTRSECPEGSESREMQDRIIAAVDRFEVWLRDLLKSSTPLRINASPTHLESWGRDLVSSRLDAARAGGVRLTLRMDQSAPEKVEIDAPQLAHAAVAVLDNAIQATGPNGEVEIRAAGADDPGRWALGFSDQGPGIPRADLRRIFEPSFTTRPNGTGIGLAMARSIVEAHGGRIEVETCRGEGGKAAGTRFRFVLPVQMQETRDDEVAGSGQ